MDLVSSDRDDGLQKKDLVNTSNPHFQRLSAYPGCDMAGRPWAPRRVAAATGPVDGAVSAAVRGRFAFRGDDVAVGWAGASAVRSWRDEAFRFREEAEGGSGVSGSAGGGSVASLADERVILDDMRIDSSCS